jgi:hypothetical protein
MVVLAHVGEQWTVAHAAIAKADAKSEEQPASCSTLFKASSKF